jgi:hypothetical protein
LSPIRLRSFVEKPRDTFLLRGGYSSAWSADVNGEEKLKVENFFPRGVGWTRGDFQRRNILRVLAPSVLKLS